MIPKPWLVIGLLCIGGASAQINDSFHAEEWVSNKSGDAAVCIRRSSLGEEKPSVIGFWVRDRSCAIENAPQNVLLDNYSNYKYALESSVPSGVIVMAATAINLLRETSESLAYFISEAQSPAVAIERYLPATERKKREAFKKEQISKAQKVLVKANSYLGDRL